MNKEKREHAHMILDAIIDGKQILFKGDAINTPDISSFCDPNFALDYSVAPQTKTMYVFESENYGRELFPSRIGNDVWKFIREVEIEL